MNSETVNARELAQGLYAQTCDDEFFETIKTWSWFQELKSLFMATAEYAEAAVALRERMKLIDSIDALKDENTRLRAENDELKAIIEKQSS